MTGNPNSISTTTASVKPSSRLVNLAAWIIVIFPDGWGIYLTALRVARWFR